MKLTSNRNKIEYSITELSEEDIAVICAALLGADTTDVRRQVLQMYDIGMPLARVGSILNLLYDELKWDEIDNGEE